MRRAVSCVLFCWLATISVTTLFGEETEIVTWDFAALGGWKPLHQCELEVQNGRLLVRCTGNDPHFSVGVQGEAGWKKLVIKAKIKGKANAQIFWTTAEHPGTSESRSVRFTLQPRRGDWAEQSVYFHVSSPLTGVRLDPQGRAGLVEIDRIALHESSAPPADPATDPAALKVPEGFQVELLYSVPKAAQGSWVSMAFDPRDGGRLICCDQYGGLYRVTPPAPGSDAATKVEPIPIKVGGAQGLLWAFDSLYLVLNSSQASGPGLYRIQDSDQDGKLDDLRLLKSFQARSPGTEHGPHGVILGPDGRSLYVVAGNMTSLPEGLREPVRHLNYEEDQLLPRAPASNGHATGLMAPGGWVCRTDADGKEWELITAGFRNPYDIAFNQHGELFTYDADMEMDIGTPWYRPTRVCHVVSGGEFGWRFGTGKWPAYYPDTLPAVADVGLGSPTGVAFGYGADFPARYRDALYINDWTNGRMFAVHLDPEGASYRGELEEFLTGTPMPLTDLVVHPGHGALYFAIGGRRTQSGLYRVTYTGTEPEKAPAANGSNEADLREQRRMLETYHARQADEAVDLAWPYLAHPDRHLRYAARVALEHQPQQNWLPRAFEARQADTVLQSLLAVVRSGRKKLAPRVLEKLNQLEWDALSERQRVDLLRVYALLFLRLDPPSPELTASLAARLEPLFPTTDRAGNHELCRLLVFLDSARVAEPALRLMASAVTQEDRLFYGITLRSLKSGWTPDLRRRYFQELNACETAAATGDYTGGGHFQVYVQMCREEASKQLTDSERTELASVLDARIEEAVTTGSPTPRKFIQNWTMPDLLPELARVSSGRSYSNGESMYRAANCVQCHRFNQVGGIFGPDITQVSKRYSRQVLLREILEPSQQVSDQYRAHTIVTENGQVYTGRILNDDGQRITLATDPLKPAHVLEVEKSVIDEMVPAGNSLMPAGLVNTLTRDDILDLLAFLESGGDQEHANFREAEAAAEDEARVTVPPQELGLHEFYQQYVSAGGYPIVSSGKVDPYALREAAYIVNMMLSRRPDVREAMVKSGSRLIVMAHSEFTTDIPEYSKMRPRDFWDRRARGLGGSRRDPVCSCAEENLLSYSGDPYSTENILIHEFAHNIHLRGMINVDETFDDRLKRTYDKAMAAGLWKGKYASVNHAEYFAEGVQSWFNNNRPPDHDHNHVDTRKELKEYDPGLAAICAEVFRDTELVYTKPETRLRDHLAGYDPRQAPEFKWPSRLEKAGREILEKAKKRNRDAEEASTSDGE